MEKLVSDFTMVAIAADDAWQRELVRLFGKQACDARYTAAGKGSAGSRLRALHDAKQAADKAAHDAWLESRRVN